MRGSGFRGCPPQSLHAPMCPRRRSLLRESAPRSSRRASPSAKRPRRGEHGSGRREIRVGSGPRQGMAAQGPALDRGRGAGAQRFMTTTYSNWIARSRHRAPASMCGHKNSRGDAWPPSNAQPRHQRPDATPATKTPRLRVRPAHRRHLERECHSWTPVVKPPRARMLRRRSLCVEEGNC